MTMQPSPGDVQIADIKRSRVYVPKIFELEERAFGRMSAAERKRLGRRNAVIFTVRAATAIAVMALALAELMQLAGWWH